MAATALALSRAFARWTAFLLVLTLALPASALAQVAHRCRASGHLTFSCCCHQRPERGARLQDTDCCAGKATPGVPVTAAPHPVTPALDAPALVVRVEPPARPEPPRALAAAPALVPAAARAPPLLHPRGVYLEVCSFLI